MTAIGIILTLAAAIVTVFSPRRFALLGVTAAVCYITQDEQIVFLGFHLTAIRFVLLAGLVRILARREFRQVRGSRVDWAVLAYPAVVTFVYTVRLGTSEAFVYQLGCSYDIVLSYLVFRYMLRELSDVWQFLGDVAVLIVPLGAFMVMESVTHHNMFGISLGETYVREGHSRCTGSFRSPITAGVFGATLIPLFVGVFRAGERRGAAVAGVLSAAAITYTSHSSGPLMAFLSGLTALAFWPLRRDMRSVRWGIAAALLGLHLVMKPPVWFILAKLSDLTGGDGWHRSYLMDQAIHHFGDWWILGTSDTADWAATTLAWGQADLTNQYIASGVDGGLAAVILFVLILVRCFQSLGRAATAARASMPKTEVLMWCCGCSLFAHVVTMFSVTYFDQMHVAWWAFLAMVSVAAADALVREPTPEPAEPSTSLHGDAAAPQFRPAG